MAIPGAGVEERVAAEQSGLLVVTEEADMGHRVPRGIHALEHDGPADLDDVAFIQSAIDTADALGRPRVGKDLGLRRCDQSFIPASVVQVLVRVEDLGDGPPLLPSRIEA